MAFIEAATDELVIKMRLPEEGTYALKLFAEEILKESGEIPNVCNYLIKCTNPDVHNEPYPETHDGTLGENHLAGKLGVKQTSALGELLLLY